MKALLRILVFAICFFPLASAAEESGMKEVDQARADLRSRTETALEQKLNAAKGGIEKSDRLPVIEMLQGLVFCLGLLCLFTYLMKKSSGVKIEGGKQRLVLKERLPLTQKAAAHLIECDGKSMLIVTNGEQVQVQAMASEQNESRSPVLVEAQGSASSFSNDLDKECLEQLKLSA